MKKLLILSFLSLFITILFAQSSGDTSAHLSFKGVPINGTLNEYVSKLKKAGFIQVSSEDGVAILQGDFAGYKNCFVGVSTLKQVDLVHKIVVLFPDRDTWSNLEANYMNLKSMLTEKYGEAMETIEKFDSRLEPRDDNSRMHEVRMNRCKYYVTWQMESGTIQLSIDHGDTGNCFVKLAYFDKVNSKLIEKRALDDL